LDTEIVQKVGLGNGERNKGYENVRKKDNRVCPGAHFLFSVVCIGKNDDELIQLKTMQTQEFGLGFI